MANTPYHFQDFQGDISSFGLDKASYRPEVHDYHTCKFIALNSDLIVNPCPVEMLVSTFIILKPELLTQYPASNDEKDFDLRKKIS